MARNVFSITAPSSTVRLDAKGHGEVPFSVSNLTANVIRGRARVVATDPKLANWFKITGDAERDFAPNGTQQYTVQLNTAPGANPGKYSFRLDVFSVALPDEEYAQGPNIGFEIAAPSAPPKPNFPIWIIPVLVLVILAALGVTVYEVWYGGHTIPSPTPQPSSTITAQPSPVITPRPRPTFSMTNQRVMLINAQTGKCLTIAGGRSTDNNVPALQFDCDSDPSRTWRINATGGDVYQISNVQTGKCLTIAGGVSTANNVPALQFNCDSDPSRTWRIRPAG
jgi:hypothetical protein